MESTLTGFTKVKHEVIQQALDGYQKHCKKCSDRFKELKQVRLNQYRNSFSYKYLRIGKKKTDMQIIYSFDPCYGLLFDFSSEWGGVLALITDPDERDMLWEWWSGKHKRTSEHLMSMIVSGIGETYLTGEACQFISRFSEGYDNNKV